ncbi:MAG: D-tyrosyl-tRNA(Tyr) deacylase [Deltaproteobacteria bacterium HGW-Deltaproteobacteria-19]|jgi:D-tyrosyl-tRNA(Tyr) deacylase|nr:MAG: D-tyrosyl-tRNA(Tyr) deacylase [Deltaproteobacteria bacterium HGW-Deltaproteobacteria-19]
MRAVIQRVSEAGVTVGEKNLSAIGAGLLVFLGVEQGDGEADAEYLLEKIINLRIFEDPDGKMNLSLVDTGGSMLVISQFTLLADCRKGRRPSFVHAEEPVRARSLYSYFVGKLRERLGRRVAEGEFQAMMKVRLVNDGPVTIWIDSRKEP